MHFIFLNQMEHQWCGSHLAAANKKKVEDRKTVGGPPPLTFTPEIFDKFVKNSIASYTPGEKITVDEQLFPTKSRCPFTQYMANKPDKFGIKFWVAADVETKYMLNAIPYLGKDDSSPAGQRLSDNIVMRLMEPFLGEGRNVTTGNFFTSLALANDLLADKTTIVGTMSKNRREMPPCTQAQSERYSTKVLRAGKVTLTIYQAKPKRNVCILSTMHQTVSTDNGAKKLPETLSHYNSTKAGVDDMDNMARLYSVNGGKCRWPVAVFYNILDLAAINAHVLYKQCMNVTISRRKFILELVKELCAHHKMARATGAIARKRLLPETPSPPAKRRQCQIGRCSGNKTCDICQTCKRLVCGKCSKNAPKLCSEC
ncbi:uncharacterized protein LOC115811199 isoform X1 [Chanos chanos]|uniref:Uncharacterized protein LOC115811199 isoform X1 n=2 Tax=Chanos chanos TaxID=29144 RepID=A0A6J2VD96_CHACN|nr:uncharacterized protein LOC115811199 isoform X1 [Chanos chanos]